MHKSKIIAIFAVCWIITIIFRPIEIFHKWCLSTPAKKITEFLQWMDPFPFKKMIQITKKALHCKFQTINFFQD